MLKTSVEGVMPFLCSVCDFEIVNKRGLASHFRHNKDTHPPYKEYQVSLKWSGKVEGVDFIKCLECGYRGKALASHLKAHGLTGAEYRAKHGKHLPLRCEKSSQIRIAAIKKARKSKAYGGVKKVLCVGCGKPYEVHKLAQATKCVSCKEKAENAKWRGKKEDKDYVVCLDCGYKAENLTSHYMNAHPDYRERHPDALIVALGSSMRDKHYLIGRTLSEETKQKMSENAGRWNKGLTKEDHPSIQAISESCMGRESWSKDLTMEEDERLQRTSENLKKWNEENERHWESSLKKNYELSDFESYLEEDGSLDHVRAMEGLGTNWVTLKKYATELGLVFTNKYVEEKFKQRIIRLDKEAFVPFLIKNGKVNLTKAYKILGHCHRTLNREAKRHGYEIQRALISQTICLDAVSEALGGVDYVMEWQNWKFRNPQSTYMYRYDGYFKEIGLVVEFHGHQHYEYPNAFHKSEEQHKAMVERDNQKQAYIENAPHLVYLCVRADEPYDDIGYLKGRLFQMGLV